MKNGGAKRFTSVHHENDDGLDSMSHHRTLVIAAMWAKENNATDGT